VVEGQQQSVLPLAERRQQAAQQRPGAEIEGAPRSL